MDTNFLYPNAIWSYFNEILQIPRPSGKEEKIIAYLLNFARTHKLTAKQDQCGNILITKEATKGYEHLPTVILQSHMDMVCEKDATSNHDFNKDSIPAYIDNDWIKSHGTTLGADDGIGIAAQLAILASNELRHGKIEALFTKDEECGMTGVRCMDSQFLTGKYLINLDSEEEGEIFIGCAGGERTLATFCYNTETPSEKLFFFRVNVSNLNGGHSGGDIHRQSGNAIKILARYLDKLRNKYKLYITSIEGGNLMNAIPREAEAVCAVAFENKENIRVDLNLFIAEIEEEVATTDPNFKMDLHSAEGKNVIDPATSTRLLQTLMAIPHGVIGMSKNMPDLVETSTNLAAIHMRDGNKIEIATSQRSSVNSMKDYIVSSISNLFELAGASVQHGDAYPGWTPNLNSGLLAAAKDCYKQLYHENVAIKAIHAGLECGLILEKYPHLEMISCGPTISDVHSPSEKLYIPSVERWWNFLVELLKHIPVK
ncbi:MAG: aminoacyl-histidine dipeptidase [Bacteroidales bacterium]|nr:aminoacyl-histidine dipeptidase [Bacteroidales bacterium]